MQNALFHYAILEALAIQIMHLQQIHQHHQPIVKKLPQVLARSLQMSLTVFLVGEHIVCVYNMYAVMHTIGDMVAASAFYLRWQAELVIQFVAFDKNFLLHPGEVNDAHNKNTKRP